MAEYEQMEMDIRLDSERDLKDNLVKVIQFTYNNQERDREESGSLAPVRNKNEGYGIAAAAYTRIVKCEKDLKGGMNDYLIKLQVDGDAAIKECSQLYDAALNVAMNSIKMAADMTRILNDLYYGSDFPKTLWRTLLTMKRMIQKTTSRKPVRRMQRLRRCRMRKSELKMKTANVRLVRAQRRMRSNGNPN